MHTFQLHVHTKLTETRANLINVPAAFFKPACVLIFLGAFVESSKKLSAKIFCLRLKKSFQPLALGHPMA